MVFKNRLEVMLGEIDVEMLDNPPEFNRRANALEYIEREEDSYKYQDRRWMLYSIWYSSKFNELRKQLNGSEVSQSSFDNLAFLAAKSIDSAYKALEEAKKPTSHSPFVDPKVLNGILGNIYFFIGRFVMVNPDSSLSITSLENRLSDVRGYSAESEHDFVIFSLKKSIEHYEESKRLGNHERENYSFLGESYFHLSSLTRDIPERLKYLFNSIVNLESARLHKNLSVENDCGIANSYQELGDVVKRLDLTMKPQELKSLKHFFKSQTDSVTDFPKGDNIYSFLGEMSSIIRNNDGNINRNSVKSLAKKLFRKSESEYLLMQQKKHLEGYPLSREDYSYIGKCRLRLGRLDDNPELISQAISDFTSAYNLDDSSHQICSLIGDAYFTLAHYVHFPNVSEKTRLFLSSLDFLLESGRRGNKEAEFFGLTAECYRHLLKLEFLKESPEPELVSKYISGARKYINLGSGREVV